MKGFSTISLIVVLGAAIFLGVGAYMNSLNTHRQATPAENLTNGEITTTLPDIVGQGQNLACDFKIPVSSIVNPFNKGKLWTTGGKGRSTISASVSNVSIETNAIYQNGTAYTWIAVGSRKTGMKFNPESLNEADHSLTLQERQQAEQFRSSMLFNCLPWTPDETKFILPSDVAFQEI